jgi:hypothetical protein
MTPHPSDGARLWWTLAALAPIAATVAFVLAFGVDVPYQDEWNVVPGIGRAADGALTFQDFWHPANEHVAVFPRLVIVGVACATGWNIRAAMLFTILVSCLTLLCLERILRRAGAPPWATALASALVFSLHAHENWLWSYEVHIALAIFGCVGAFALLGRERLRAPALTGAILLAWVSSWSFLNGFLAWPIGALVLALRSQADSVRRSRALAAWGVAALVATLLPASTWVRTADPHVGGAPSLVADFAARFVGAGLLGPFAHADALRAAGWAGAALVAAGGLLAAAFARSRPAALALAAVGAFGLGSAVVIAMGRAKIAGIENASASRYTAFSSLVWIVVPFVFRLALAAPGRALRVLEGVLAAAVAASLVATQVRDVEAGRELSARRGAAALALRTGEGLSAPAIQAVFGVPREIVEVLGERVAIMRRARLSLFREATAAEIDPPEMAGPITATLAIGPEGPRTVATIEARGGVPGNLAGAIVVSGAVAREEGPAAFDASGVARIPFELDGAAVPPGTTFHVVSLDRRANLVQSAVYPFAR